ncbi:replication protein [Candidatus Phytoplasma sacchari]
MENKIRYKNIFISYLDEKESFTEKDVREFFLNLIKNYDNKINYLIIGKKEKRLNVLLMLNKQPFFRRIEIFNLIIQNKKSSKAMATLEPSIIKNAISSKNIHEDIISKSEKVCEVGIPSFIQEISEKSRKEQNEEYIDYMNKIKREFDEDPEMTVEEVEKLVFGFLRQQKNYMAFERSSTVMQALKNNFSRPQRIIDSLEIRDLKTFNLKDLQIKFIINHLEKELKSLRNGNRAIGLIIEGKSGLGKTDLILAICKELNIIFNYMNRKMNFSVKTYDDENAEIDIWDDFKPSYFIENDLFESIFGGQVGFTVETAKHERDRIIKKKKINIFICNEQKSFQNFFEQRPADMKYLLSRPNVFFLKLDNKLLFKLVKNR